MAPLDFGRLRASAALCAAHGRACPTGGGRFSTGTYEALAVYVWPFTGVPAPTRGEWETSEARRCRTASPAEVKMLRAVDVEEERAATREAAKSALQWLAENPEGAESAA